jgi:hypothetical protein
VLAVVKGAPCVGRSGKSNGERSTGPCDTWWLLAGPAGGGGSATRCELAAVRCVEETGACENMALGKWLEGCCWPCRAEIENWADVLLDKDAAAGTGAGCERNGVSPSRDDEYAEGVTLAGACMCMRDDVPRPD